MGTAAPWSAEACGRRRRAQASIRSPLTLGFSRPSPLTAGRMPHDIRRMVSVMRHLTHHIVHHTTTAIATSCDTFYRLAPSRPSHYTPTRSRTAHCLLRFAAGQGAVLGGILRGHVIVFGDVAMQCAEEDPKLARLREQMRASVLAWIIGVLLRLQRFGTQTHMVSCLRMQTNP